MSYTVKISHDDLIDLLSKYDDKVNPNIKDSDMVEDIRVSYVDITIRIGGEIYDYT